MAPLGETVVTYEVDYAELEEILDTVQKSYDLLALILEKVRLADIESIEEARTGLLD